MSATTLMPTPSSPPRLLKFKKTTILSRRSVAHLLRSSYSQQDYLLGCE